MPAGFLMALAICFEVLGTVCMKLSNGFHEVIPSLFMLFFYGLGFLAFVACIARIQISIAYALWTAIGMVAISLIDIAFFDAHISGLKIVAFILISLGVIGLTFEPQPRNVDQKKDKKA
ncbi:QacE family quaternary ammonium compound efflux SMR transporter [Ignatzschineria ureiclastica]|nr:multidrug efflux SMR transporter [Ignatzschineria ureiclastica]GGZ98947.1 QacE family quaternary ammonium compound efflux SMR transporter [Ignatzschineria ureiclastica]